MKSVKPFLKQKVTWEKRVGSDRFNDATYAPPVELPARIVVRDRLLRASGTNPRAADGTEKPSTTTVMLEASPEVVLGDKLDGEIVQARTSITGLKGIIGWKCYMEPVYRSS